MGWYILEYMYGLLAESYSESSQRESSDLSVRVGILGPGNCPRLGGPSAKETQSQTFSEQGTPLLPGPYSCILILFWSFAVITCCSMSVYEDLEISASFISNAGIDTKCNFQLRTAHLTFLGAIDDPAS
jgi:hypothetical protein